MLVRADSRLRRRSRDLVAGASPSACRARRRARRRCACCEAHGLGASDVTRARAVARRCAGRACGRSKVDAVDPGHRRARRQRARRARRGAAAPAAARASARSRRWPTRRPAISRYTIPARHVCDADRRTCARSRRRRCCSPAPTCPKPRSARVTRFVFAERPRPRGARQRAGHRRCRPPTARLGAGGAAARRVGEGARRAGERGAPEALTPATRPRRPPARGAARRPAPCPSSAERRGLREPGEAEPRQHDAERPRDDPRPHGRDDRRSEAPGTPSSPAARPRPGRAGAGWSAPRTARCRR